MTALLERSKRTGLSTKWTLSSVGGIDKVPTCVALFRAQRGLKLATLLHLQKKHQQKVENPI